MQGQEPAARTKAAGSVAEVWAASELWVIPSRLLGLGLLHARLTLTALLPGSSQHTSCFPLPLKWR